jgi:hypothetical protein
MGVLHDAGTIAASIDFAVESDSVGMRPATALVAAVS